MYIRRFNETAVEFTLGEGAWLACAFLFAALTGMGAIMRVPLSPVPLTMQVFFVLLSGMFLGPVWGPASQLIYLVMGCCGAPFFAAAPYTGPAVLFGPTGGYLWGFVLASGVVGWLTGRVGKNLRNRVAGIAVLLGAGLAGVAVIYVTGTSWLGAWLGMHGKDASLAFALGVRPFIAADLAKAALAAAVGSSLLLRRNGHPFGEPGS
jgi:biotin transport system substrate-specific component